MRIPWFRPELGEREQALVGEVIASNFPNDGSYTDRFAERFAALCGTKHAVAVTSGTAAIFTALAACGVGRGDEVLVPDLTFIATANAVTLLGATPVLVDVRRDTFGLDPERAEAAITPRTRAIVPVHVSGRDAGIADLVSLARKYGLRVVEDSAEAIGSKVDGRALGSFGDAGTFSFSPFKAITTGQGGMVITDDDELVIRLRQVKDQGRATRGTGGADEHPVLGYNFKLTNVQAAIGLAQLERLPARTAHLRRLYDWYSEELSGLSPVLILAPVDLTHGAAPCWIDCLAEDRDDLAALLEERGIETRKYWFPLHTQMPYRQEGSSFPNSSYVSQHALWLPSSFSLTREDVAEVCTAIREFARGRTAVPGS